MEKLTAAGAEQLARARWNEWVGSRKTTQQREQIIKIVVDTVHTGDSEHVNNKYLPKRNEEKKKKKQNCFVVRYTHAFFP